MKRLVWVKAGERFLCPFFKERVPSLMILVGMLTACQSNSSIQQNAPSPQAAHPNGTTVLVKSVDTTGGGVAVDLLAINGSDGNIKLSSTTDPIILSDSAGNQYTVSEANVTLAPYTADRIAIRFAGNAPEGDRLTLNLNSKYGNEFTSPPMTLDIPVSRGKAQFAEAIARQVSFSEVLAYHPNGVSLSVNGIQVTEQLIAVEIEAVNGSQRPITLSSVTDRAFLQDEQSNRYSLIPSATNLDLSIPPGQKLIGTLHFAGRLPDTHSQLTLHFNDQYGGDQDYSRNPKLVVADLVVPISNEASEDGN